MIDKYQMFVEIALAQQGRPYIWGGKGQYAFKDGKLQKHPFMELDDGAQPISVFDCSGLVTHALWQMGIADLRATHSAAEILRTFPETTEAHGDGTLILYPGHVAVDLGRGRVVDAHRGDHTTTSILEANQRRARVEIHRDIRPHSSILGYRRVPLDKSELKP